MRYVFRGQVGTAEFLKIDESELLTKTAQVSLKTKRTCLS